jgi:hypothetical protein
MNKITKEMVLAGRCTVTINTPDMGHRTYKITHKDAEGRFPEAWFVKLLTGPDNTSSFTYMGKLDDFTGQLILTGKSKYAEDSYVVKLFNKVMARVWCDDHQAFESKGFTLQHAGTCCRCGRKLTTPASIETGIGPECRKHFAAPASDQVITAEMVERSEEAVAEELGRREEAEAQHRLASLHNMLVQGARLERADRMKEKAAFAELEARQERAAYMAEMHRERAMRN